MVSDDGKYSQNGNGENPPPPIAHSPTRPANPTDHGAGGGSGSDKSKPPSRFWTRFKQILEVIESVAIIVTMIFVGLSWREMGRQYKIMSDQLTDARKAAADSRGDTERLLKAAEKQATAMTDSVGPATTSAAKAAETSAENTIRMANASERSASTAAKSLRTAIADLRAHVAFNGLAGFTTIDAPCESCKILIVNSGKTPAINMRTHAEMTVVPITAKIPDYDLTLSPGEVVSVSVLGVGQINNMPLSVGRQLTAGEITSVTSGAARLYARAIITYDDVFTPPHEGAGLRKTGACIVYIPALKNFLSCPFGNYAN